MIWDKDCSKKEDILNEMFNQGILVIYYFSLIRRAFKRIKNSS